jgi:hypothetical protein
MAAAEYNGAYEEGTASNSRLEKVHSKEFHDLYLSPNISSVIKSSRMRRMEHVVRTRQMSVLV